MDFKDWDRLDQAKQVRRDERCEWQVQKSEMEDDPKTALILLTSGLAQRYSYLVPSRLMTLLSVYPASVISTSTIQCSFIIQWVYLYSWYRIIRSRLKYRYRKGARAEFHFTASPLDVSRSH